MSLQDKCTKLQQCSSVTQCIAVASVGIPFSILNMWAAASAATTSGCDASLVRLLGTFAAVGLAAPASALLGLFVGPAEATGSIIGGGQRFVKKPNKLVTWLRRVSLHNGNRVLWAVVVAALLLLLATWAVFLLSLHADRPSPKPLAGSNSAAAASAAMSAAQRIRRQQTLASGGILEADTSTADMAALTSSCSATIWRVALIDCIGGYSISCGILIGLLCWLAHILSTSDKQ
jgi:hypothetical protein